MRSGHCGSGGRAVRKPKSSVSFVVHAELVAAFTPPNGDDFGGMMDLNRQGGAAKQGQGDGVMKIRNLAILDLAGCKVGIRSGRSEHDDIADVCGKQCSC